MDELKPFLEKLSQFIDRLEPLLPEATKVIDFSKTSAFRWASSQRLSGGFLQPIDNPSNVYFHQLMGIDAQTKQIRQNTLQFLKGFPANNVLLSGSRGTGKSSLIKACLTEYADQGLKMIEIDRDDLPDLSQILILLQNQPYRFILFCDDLSFEDHDASYKSLKAMLDGSLMSPPENILIYASSNRRHLLPEYMSENNQYHTDDRGEINPSEAIEEKISLSERFGLWLSFYTFSQNEFLLVVEKWLKAFAPDVVFNEKVKAEALQFALQRGSRSGRVAQQFVKNYIGLSLLDKQ